VFPRLKVKKSIIANNSISNSNLNYKNQTKFQNQRDRFEKIKIDLTIQEEKD
jgi:hypothetical protein